MPRKEYSLEAVNERLKAAHAGVQVLQRGSKLSLRATLPPRPGSGKSKATQQTIAIGKYATAAGFEEAEDLALELRRQLQRGIFKWEAWLGAETEGETCGAAIARYKPHCLKKIINKDGDEGERVWLDRFWLYLKRLPQDAPLTPEILIRAAEKSTQADTRSRQLCCQEFRRLAEFVGIEVDFAGFAGDYSPKQARRDIPTDEEIEVGIDQIKNPQWQWIAAMMATYGLRDHECWLCRLEWRKTSQGAEVLACFVEDGKTGPREVQPSRPDWVERWQLWEVKRPPVAAKRLKDYGDRTSKAFRRERVGFRAYVLRHATAIRFSVKLRLPLPTAAALMGHSPQVHLSIYNRWISAQQHQRVYDEIMAQRP